MSSSRYPRVQPSYDHVLTLKVWRLLHPRTARMFFPGFPLQCTFDAEGLTRAEIRFLLREAPLRVLRWALSALGSGRLLGFSIAAVGAAVG